MHYSRQATALENLEIKPFSEVVLSQADFRDMWELLHPASTSSCDIAEEHPSVVSIRYQ